MDDFLKSQRLDIKDDGKVVLTNHFNTDELDRKMYEERKIEQDGKEMRKVCEIPLFEFTVDPLLQKYQMCCEMHDGDEARKYLRMFLKLNPQYLATTKRF